MLFTIVIVVASYLIYRILSKKPSYWKSRHVKERESTWTGYYRAFTQKDGLVNMVKIMYRQFPTERYSGIYNFKKPILIIRDPDLIKQITVKDFDHFSDHTNNIPADLDPLWASNLFALQGQKWREMRSILSPVFTGSKMKSMFTLINDVSGQFVDFFSKEKNVETSWEMKDTLARYATDVIATCAFGIEVDSLNERENEFYRMAKVASDFSNLATNLRLMIAMMIPKLAKVVNARIFSEEVSNFFVQVVRDTIRARNEKNIIRPDMINILMEAQRERMAHENDKNYDKMEISEFDIAAQATIFFLAGFDTISGGMTLIAYEIAANLDVQEKLRDEVDSIKRKFNGNLTYDHLAEMKYMDMVISESLRKWPPAAMTDRLCVKPYTIEPTDPSEVPVKINVGDTIWIPVIGLHLDEKYFTNPEVFDPERFNDENKKSMNAYAYVPFGFGPRNCIGSRFAVMEIKTLFYHILSNFEMSVASKTQLPLQIGTKAFNIAIEGGVWVDFKKRGV